MDIKQKYAEARSYINNGDIALFRGNSFIAKGIQWADKAYWNHAAVIHIDPSDGRLYAIQAVSEGVTPDYLSQVINGNKDFCIGRPQFPQSIIDEAVKQAMDKSEDGIPYNTMQILQVLGQRKLGIDIKKLGSDKTKNICSVFAGITYGQYLPLTCYTQSPEYLKDNFVTPQDLQRFGDPTQIKFLFNDYIGK